MNGNNGYGQNTINCRHFRRPLPRDGIRPSVASHRAARTPTRTAGAPPISPGVWMGFEKRVNLRMRPPPAAWKWNHGAPPASCCYGNGYSLNSLKNCLDQWGHFRSLAERRCALRVVRPRLLRHLSTFATSTMSTPCSWPSQASNHGLCDLPTMETIRAPGSSRKVSRMLAIMRRLRISQPATHI